MQRAVVLRHDGARLRVAGLGVQNCSTAVAHWLFSLPAGMFGIIAALEALTRASRERADAVVAFFAPALDWIQRWLPLFYVPSLIMLPLALRDIQGKQKTYSPVIKPG